MLSLLATASWTPDNLVPHGALFWLIAGIVWVIGMGAAFVWSAGRKLVLMDCISLMAGVFAGAMLWPITVALLILLGVSYLFWVLTSSSP